MRCPFREGCKCRLRERAWACIRPGGLNGGSTCLECVHRANAQIFMQIFQRIVILYSMAYRNKYEFDDCEIAGYC